jgi:sugar lactone lactonase YvrE
LFIQLDGIAIADDDTIYVSDSLANRVRKIEAGIIDTVAGTGEIGYSGDAGPGTEAALHWPTALELDGDGNLYIVDTFNHAVRRLAPDGTITTVAGTGVEGDAGDGGMAIAARLSQPFGLALDQDGTVYIGDRGNFRVRRISPDGMIDSIAGIGREGLGSEGPASASELGYLARVALDGDDLLIADQSNGMIWRLRLR